MLAVNILQSCYEENQQDAHLLLLREIPEYGNLNALKVILSSCHINIVSCTCTQSLLVKIWYGRIFIDTPFIYVRRTCLNYVFLWLC
jgi:hypothetical protein